MGSFWILGFVFCQFLLNIAHRVLAGLDDRGSSQRDEKWHSRLRAADFGEIPLAYEDPELQVKIERRLCRRQQERDNLPVKIKRRLCRRQQERDELQVKIERRLCRRQQKRDELQVTPAKPSSRARRCS